MSEVDDHNLTYIEKVSIKVNKIRIFIDPTFKLHHY